MEHINMQVKPTMHRLTYSDISIADTTNTWTFTNLYGDNLSSDYLIGMYGRILVPFAGITGPLYMEIGEVEDTDSMMGKIELLTALAGQELFSNFPIETQSHGCKYSQRSRHGRPAPIVTFTSDSGNLSSLTAGWLELILVSLAE